MSSTYKNLVKNTAVIALGSFGSKAISFFMLPIFTRILTRNDYGKIDFFTTTVSLLMPFLTLGIVEAVFRFTMGDINDEEKSRVLSSALIINVIGTAAFLAVSPILYKIRSISELAIYMVFAIAISSVSSVFKTFVRAQQKLAVYAIGDIIHTVSFATFGIVFVAVLRYGVQGYLLATILSGIADILYLIIAGKIYSYISFRKISITKIKAMLKYSLPMIPNNLSWWIMNVSDRYLLIFFLGFASNGIYSVSYKFMSLITILNGIFYQAWQISAVQQYNQKDKNVFYSNVFKILYTFLLFTVIIFAIILKPLVSLMTGSDFYEAWNYIPFLFFGAVFSAFSSFFGVGYIASKKSIGAFRTSIIGAGINFGINICFIPILGIQAAALSTMLAFLTMWIVRIFETRKYFQITINWRILTFNLLLAAISLFANFIPVYGIAWQIAATIVFIYANRREIILILSKIKKAFISKLRRRK